MTRESGNSDEDGMSNTYVTPDGTAMEVGAPPLATLAAPKAPLRP